MIGQAQGAPEGRNPFTFPPGVLKGEGLAKKEGAGLEGTEKDTAPVFRVTTILVSGQIRVAAINGILLRRGEEMNGYRIMEINEKQVILSKGKEKLVLRIDPIDKGGLKKMDPPNKDARLPK
jgi:hypothetical protein